MFQPSDDLRFVIRDANKVVAHASCFPRAITVAGRPMTILALAAVCTRTEYRKRGLGSVVIKSCFARVDRGEFPYCLLQTSHKNRALYEHLGASMVHNRIVNSLAADPHAYPFWDEIAMAYPSGFPQGDIDLLGSGY